ncbi:hypothetical protein RJT34_27753 [Clitoria ternatea]|uniref:Peptidase A1 domain-containing protein n=1 Tax=Clitoria ternatea TaxID=43366 RepID=A0AAN9F863_CLITE
MFPSTPPSSHPIQHTSFVIPFIESYCVFMAGFDGSKKYRPKKWYVVFKGRNLGVYSVNMTFMLIQMLDLDLESVSDGSNLSKICCSDWEPGVTFLVAKFDGILGLGFQEISVGYAVPVWYNMHEKVLSRNRYFHFGLTINQRKKNEFDMGDVLIDSKPIGYCADGCSAIAYSRTSLLAGPTTVITMINHAIGAAGVISNESKTIVTEYG